MKFEHLLKKSKTNKPLKYLLTKNEGPVDSGIYWAFMILISLVQGSLCEAIEKKENVTTAEKMKVVKFSPFS